MRVVNYETVRIRSRPESPPVSDRRAMCDRIAANGFGYCREAERNLPRIEYPVHLQIFLRQSQSQFRKIVSRLWSGCRIENPQRSEETDRRAGVDRRAQHRRNLGGRGRGRCAANPGVPLPADRFHSRRGTLWPPGEYQEGAIFVAVGYAERGGEGA